MNESIQKLHDLAINLKESAKSLNDFRTGLREVLNSINPSNLKEKLIINKLENMLNSKAIYKDRYMYNIIDFIKRMISPCKAYMIINISNIDTPEGQIEIIHILLRFMKQQEELSPETPVKHSPNTILMEKNPNVLVERFIADSISTFFEKNLKYYYLNGIINEHLINSCKLLKNFDGCVNANFIELIRAYTFQHQEGKCLKNLRKDLQHQPSKKTETRTLPTHITKNIFEENSFPTPLIKKRSNKSQEEK